MKAFPSLPFLLMLISTLLGVSPLKAQDMAQEPAPDSIYIALIDSSFTYAHSGQLDRAEQALRSAMARQPQSVLNVYLLNNLGGLQQMQGRTDEAILSYSAALERMPDEQSIRYNRARLFSLVGKLPAAITDYSLLVAKAPDNELFRYQRAMTYMLTGQYDLADLDLTTIIEHNGESLKARLGYALLETLRGRYDNAERLYDYLVSKLSRSAEVYEGRARLYLAKRMRGYAQRDLDRALGLSAGKPSPTLYRLRAELARLSGDEVTARRDEETARSLELQFDPLRPQR